MNVDNMHTEGGVPAQYAKLVARDTTHREESTMLCTRVEYIFKIEEGYKPSKSEIANFQCESDYSF